MDKITHKVRCEQGKNIIKECLASILCSAPGFHQTAYHSDLEVEEINLR